MFYLVFMLKCILYLVNINITSAATSTTNKVSTRDPPNHIKTILPIAQKNILNDLSWPLRLALMKENLNVSKEICSSKTCKTVDKGNTRRVGVQALMKSGRREDAETTADPESDDTNMKMKLFRLMYETVRDSDLKVKRAELIKKSYTNSSSFEVGYLLGDVTDKFNIMTDISLTLKRLYHEWKPIEHINAYEQVANLAIDIGHIIDMIKGLEKKINTEEGDVHKKNEQTSDKNSSIPGYFQIQ